MSHPTTDRRAPVVLGLALLGVSLSGPLVRLSHAHPIAIATWRLAFSLLFIVVALALTGEWRQWARLTAREAAVGVGAGAMLALHFWSWNTSVTMTTVAASRSSPGSGCVRRRRADSGPASPSRCSVRSSSRSPI
jgi:hypothetical protein